MYTAAQIRQVSDSEAQHIMCAAHTHGDDSQRGGGAGYILLLRFDRNDERWRTMQ